MPLRLPQPDRRPHAAPAARTPPGTGPRDPACRAASRAQRPAVLRLPDHRAGTGCRGGLAAMAGHGAGRLATVSATEPGIVREAAALALLFERPRPDLEQTPPRWRGGPSLQQPSGAGRASAASQSRPVAAAGGQDGSGKTLQAPGEDHSGDGGAVNDNRRSGGCRVPRAGVSPPPCCPRPRRRGRARRPPRPEAPRAPDPRCAIRGSPR